MISQVTLENWTSFGAKQTVALEAITLLVGANNSGKSNFLRVFPRFVEMPELTALHRPTLGPQFERGIVASAGAHTLAWRVRGEWTGALVSNELFTIDETVLYENRWNPGGTGPHHWIFRGQQRGNTPIAVMAPNWIRDRVSPQDREIIDALFTPVLNARLVHLSADSIRQPNGVGPVESVAHDGRNLAAMIARWTLEHSTELAVLNEILPKCLPEMRRLMAIPTRNPGEVGLVFEQKDGERFPAEQVSDGVVLFSALLAHAVAAPRNGLVLIEEPERGLHPRRLVELLDVLRTLVQERGTQFILATHSPGLLTLMRDETESILLFRRSPKGTQVRRLSDVPELVETLSRAEPGELLSSGAFNEAYDGESGT